MWPRLGKMLVSMVNISSHENQTFDSFPKAFLSKENFPQIEIEIGWLGLSCQNCLCKIWAQQQGGWHLEVKRTFAGSGDNIDDQNFILQFRVSKLKKCRE